MYYKNDRVSEIDEHVGDIYRFGSRQCRATRNLTLESAILDAEGAIIRELEGFVLKHQETYLECSEFVAQLDW